MSKFFDETKVKFDCLKQKKCVKILAIESSCDETSVAVVENGRKILSNVISTQIEIHRRFGGVVPEVASRNHISAISSVYKEALSVANINAGDIDAVAVTYGAGLVGALLVGVNFAKALAFSLNVPLIKVNHIHGHIAANYLSHSDLKPPFTCLMVSGGHTAILDIDNYNSFKLMGTTFDDAAGEAFDKVARVLGLEYPGGPAIDREAKKGEANIVFAKDNMKNSLDFSFSGIKTAVINYVHNLQQKGDEINVQNVAASFQKTVANELATKAARAAATMGHKILVAAGGVSANSFLKGQLEKACEKENIKLYLPELKLCTDNAAMIGSAAYYMIKDGIGLADLSLTAVSRIDL